MFEGIVFFVRHTIQKHKIIPYNTVRFKGGPWREQNLTVLQGIILFWKWLISPCCRELYFFRNHLKQIWERHVSPCYMRFYFVTRKNFTKKITKNPTQCRRRAYGLPTREGPWGEQISVTYTNYIFFTCILADDHPAYLRDAPSVSGPVSTQGKDHAGALTPSNY